MSEQLLPNERDNQEDKMKVLERIKELEKKNGELESRILVLEARFDTEQPEAPSVRRSVAGTMSLESGHSPSARNWPLIKNMEFSEGEFSPKLTSLFDERDWDRISTKLHLNEAFATLEKKGVQFAGQKEAEEILANPDNIPDEWKQYCLLFPGTTRRRDKDDRDDFFPILRFEAPVVRKTRRGNLTKPGGWELSFQYMGNIVGYIDRAICMVKK